MTYKIVKELVGLCCPDSGVDELLVIVGLNKRDVMLRPKFVTREITEYLDDLVKNP